MQSASAAISQGPGNVIFKVLVGIVLIVCLYYFYQWLNGNPDAKDYILYNSIDSGLSGMETDTAKTVFTAANVPGIYSGGEFSVSTWVYVNNWLKNAGVNKPFLKVSGGEGSYNTLVLYLGQNTNKLGVRVTYDSTTNVLNSAAMTDLVAMSSANFSDSSSTTTPSGDIDNIPLQKWVNITVVLAGRTLDVYIDGKLSRSTVFPSMYMVDGAKPTVTLAGASGFGGLIGQTRVTNFAYSPDQVYKNYISGPFDTSFLSIMTNYLNPGAYKISIVPK